MKQIVAVGIKKTLPGDTLTLGGERRLPVATLRKPPDSFRESWHGHQQVVKDEVAGQPQESAFGNVLAVVVGRTGGNWPHEQTRPTRVRGKQPPLGRAGTAD